MDDLTATRLCADAMGWKYVAEGPAESCIWRASHYITEAVGSVLWIHHWRPLSDDAQCLALVKRFRLQIEFLQDVWAVTPEKQFDPDVMNESLNHAIVYCVAEMQAAKGVEK